MEKIKWAKGNKEYKVQQDQEITTVNSSKATNATLKQEYPCKWNLSVVVKLLFKIAQRQLKLETSAETIMKRWNLTFFSSAGAAASAAAPPPAAGAAATATAAPAPPR